jgi:hypothetical protein
VQERLAGSLYIAACAENYFTYIVEPWVAVQAMPTLQRAFDDRCSLGLKDGILEALDFGISDAQLPSGREGATTLASLGHSVEASGKPNECLAFTIGGTWAALWRNHCRGPMTIGGRSRGSVHNRAVTLVLSYGAPRCPRHRSLQEVLRRQQDRMVSTMALAGFRPMSRGEITV